MPDAPLLPVPNRTHPFWLTEPDYHLQNHRTTSELPANADIVIVGSGLSGVLTAYHLFERGIPKGKKVVMIEADEFCSGATARNGSSSLPSFLLVAYRSEIKQTNGWMDLCLGILSGGHCKPTTYYGFHSTSTQFGSSTADEMLRFEESHLDRYVRLVEKESIDCDLHVTRAVDVFFDQAEADTARSDFERRRREYPSSVERGDVRELKDPEELRRISGVKGGVWGVSYPAGHLWPYKLACGREFIGCFWLADHALMGSLDFSPSSGAQNAVERPKPSNKNPSSIGLAFELRMEAHHLQRNDHDPTAHPRLERLHRRYPTRVFRENHSSEGNGVFDHPSSVAPPRLVPRPSEIHVRPPVQAWGERLLDP